MATTLPSDLYVPTIAKEVFAYEFVKSQKILQQAMGGADAPIMVDNLEILEKGGHYIDQPVLKPISGLVTARDITSAAAVTPLGMSSRNDNGVAIRLKSGPVAIQEDAGRISSIKNEQLAAHFGSETAKETIALIQRYVVAAAKAAIMGMTSTPNTKSVWAAADKTKLSTNLLIQGRQLLLDKADKIKLWIMRSSPEADLAIQQAGMGVTGIADVVVRSGVPQTLGIPYICAEMAELLTADAGFDKFYTLGLCAGFCRVQIGGIKFYTAQQDILTETVSNYLRADIDFVIQIGGKKWDKDNGGANPSLAAVGTTTNWDDGFTDSREVGGVVIEHNADAA